MKLIEYQTIKNHLAPKLDRAKENERRYYRNVILLFLFFIAICFIIIIGQIGIELLVISLSLLVYNSINALKKDKSEIIEEQIKKLDLCFQQKKSMEETMKELGIYPQTLDR